MRGSRVQAVVNELQGEKIDIVNWSEDPAIVVANALSPAEVLRVNVDQQAKKLDVILTEENLSKAIGRRGQNVRLATKLLNFEINIMTDQEDSERRQIDFKEKTFGHHIKRWSKKTVINPTHFSKKNISLKNL